MSGNGFANRNQVNRHGESESCKNRRNRHCECGGAMRRRAASFQLMNQTNVVQRAKNIHNHSEQN